MSDTLARDLAKMLGGSVGIGWSVVSDAEDLWPEERPAVIRAIPKRQAEFAAGRRAARIALQSIGHPGVALPVGETRAPLWPPGILGTITHDAGLAMSAVLPEPDAKGLGIDLTMAEPLPGETRRAILPHASEADLDPLTARVGFSAKETLFKALFRQVGTFFGFAAVDVRPDLATERFDIRLRDPLGDIPVGTTWQGRFVIRGGRILTALVIV